jgi:hypothetical protein
MADEVPAEGVAVASVLLLEVLRPVLAQDFDACVEENGEPTGRHVLGGDDDGDPGADLLLDLRVTLPELLRRRRR